MAEPTSLDAIADSLGAADVPVGMMSSPDGAMTLLLTAVEDCPAIVERLGEEAGAELLRDHHVIVRGVVEARDGQVVKVERDAVMASFASAHAALRSAIDLQRTFADLEVEPVGRLRLRAGLHSGFVISSGQDVFGRNVVIAARIADQAAGGEILVSAAVREYTQTDPTYRFAARGAAHFRGVHGEHEMYAVDWADPPDG
jgi:class 3 adenylate cyclase